MPTYLEVGALVWVRRGLGPPEEAGMGGGEEEEGEEEEERGGVSCPLPAHET